MIAYFDVSEYTAKCNEMMAKEEDKEKVALMRELKSLALECTRPIALEKRIRTIVFNSDGKTDLDKATLLALKEVPFAGAYDYLFGGLTDAEN